MNREDIIRMAREAHLVEWLPNSTHTDGCWWIDAHEPGEELERFAALVAAGAKAEERKAIEPYWAKSIEYAKEAEREACAKVCDELEDKQWKIYKGFAPYGNHSPGYADPRTEGLSDGAAICSEAIRARSNT